MINIGTFLITDARGNILSPASQGFLDLAATGLNEILQNVRVICNTRIGSVWGDRRFGLDFSFVDAPMNKAELMIVQQVCVGLSHFEPRVSFVGIQFQPNVANPGELDVTLAIDINRNELVLPNG